MTQMFRHIEQDLEIWISQRDILHHLEICASSVEGFVRNRGSETVAATLPHLLLLVLLEHIIED